LYSDLSSTDGFKQIWVVELQQLLVWMMLLFQEMIPLLGYQKRYETFFLPTSLITKSLTKCIMGIQIDTATREKTGGVFLSFTGKIHAW
jgi:hypothetical protein